MDDYEAWVDSIIVELLDAETIKAWGPEAGFWLAIKLGLIDGDTMELDESGSPIVSTPKAEIEAAIKSAREAKARGIPMAKHFENI